MKRTFALAVGSLLTLTLTFYILTLLHLTLISIWDWDTYDVEEENNGITR